MITRLRYYVVYRNIYKNLQLVNIEDVYIGKRDSLTMRQIELHWRFCCSRVS